MRINASQICTSESEDRPIEEHPLHPFLPRSARLLMLGSFPPPQRRWSMPFFYPNFQNDMWRIFGLIFKSDKEAFVDATAKAFRMDDIITLLKEKGIALFDTALAIRRLQANASDRFLHIVQPTDIAALLSQIPQCHAVAATGQKAADELCRPFGIIPPQVGQSISANIGGCNCQLYRMPSTSRAYPAPLTQKAEIYAKMFRQIGLL